MLRSVALVRTDVSEELRASIIRSTRIGLPGSMFYLRRLLQLLVNANFPSSQSFSTLMMEAIRSAKRRF
jgi:hypothetical protein